MPKAPTKSKKRRGFDLGGRTFEDALAIALNTPLPADVRRKRQKKRPARGAAEEE